MRGSATVQGDQRSVKDLAGGPLAHANAGCTALMPVMQWPLSSHSARASARASSPLVLAGFDQKHDVSGKIAGGITSAATGLTKALQKKPSSSSQLEPPPPSHAAPPSQVAARRPPPPPPPEGHEGVYLAPAAAAAAHNGTPPPPPHVIQATVYTDPAPIGSQETVLVYTDPAPVGSQARVYTDPAPPPPRPVVEVD